MRRLIQSIGFIAFLLSFSINIFAQTYKITGIVKDKQSDEPIPFASAFSKNRQYGTLTDSIGRFTLRSNSTFLGDTLEITSVGYQPAIIPLKNFKDSFFITVQLNVLPPSTEAVVKTKYNRAVWFWKQIQKHKLKNDRTRWDNYSYEIYNKLELDLENVNFSKLGNTKLLKPLNGVLIYVDSSSEEQPFLPVYLTETLSDYYYQKSPKRYYEIIKAARTNGFDNESMIKQLGGMYQNVNVYNNFIPVFDISFYSPLHENADHYYNFKLLDTQYLDKKRLVHLRFTPKIKGTDVFEGDCWVHDTSFAIQKITLRPSTDANINYVKKLSLIQEYKLINDTTWFLYKDKFVADIEPLGKKTMAFKGRKTATYRNVLLNNTATVETLSKTKKSEQVDVALNSLDYADSFWVSNRHEKLNKNEQAVYKVLDTLEKNPTYRRYRTTVNFLTTGTKDIGNIRIGPWYYWLSGNGYEGNRVRFDISTNKGFNKHLYLHTYMAYGFGDKRMKGRLEGRYLFNSKLWTYLHFSYRDDFDYGQVYFDQMSTDNIFATWFRRPNIPNKFQRAEEKKLEFYKETNKGIGFGITLTGKEFEALQNLPDASLFPKTDGHSFNSFEATVKLRYAFAERFIEENFYRTSLGSEYPIVDVRYTHGFPKIMKSNYTYDKIEASVSDYVKLPPYGTLYYNLFAGKVYGTIPYQFLEILPGNELYYYNRYAFNLMKRFEFLTDQYTGFNIEHNIGSGLFRYIPLTRKMKFRQFYSVKGITGSLTDENRQLNFVGNYPFKSLDKNLYLEVGTGVDNIFKFFRVDLVWRALPKDESVKTGKFGIFGSFRISF